MSTMEHVAEQTKLERLLQVDQGALAFIAEQDVEATREFRLQVSEFYYQRHQDAFRRLAGLSKLLPVSASAKIAQNLLGSVLAAGIACELPTDKAGKLAGRLPTEFLAKLSLHLEPSRAGAIIAAVDEDHTVAVAEHLVSQDEYITLARFVNVISDSTLRRIMQQIGDDGICLLKVGLYVEEKPALDKLVSLLTDSQRNALLDAAHENQLWAGMLSLLPHLSEQLQADMANLTAQRDTETRDALVRQVAEQGEWAPLVQVYARMTEDNVKESANIPAYKDDAIRSACIAAIKEAGLETELSVFVDALNA